MVWGWFMLKLILDLSAIVMTDEVDFIIPPITIWTWPHDYSMNRIDICREQKCKNNSPIKSAFRCLGVNIFIVCSFVNEKQIYIGNYTSYQCVYQYMLCLGPHKQSLWWAYRSRHVCQLVCKFPTAPYLRYYFTYWHQTWYVDVS